MVSVVYKWKGNKHKFLLLQCWPSSPQENDFVAFMNDPLNPAPSHNQPPPVESMEDQWKAYPGYQSVAFLNSNNFNQTVAENVQVLVMFYAPCT